MHLRHVHLCKSVYNKAINNGDMDMAKQRTSTDYLFTTIALDCSEIEELRRQVRITNLERRVRELRYGVALGRQRIRVRPRLGVNSPFAGMYRRGGAHWRFSSQDIRPEHGSRFDVYVNEVRS